MAPQIRIRRSINAIWEDYLNGKQQELITIIRAFKGIYDISHRDPNDPNSFFKLGGLHGEPFRGAGYANAAWWGGWCNHGNVLFPTWHRAYMLRFEEALRSIPGCESVTLPYWDETGTDTQKNGVPGIFLQPTFVLDGVEIPNPLYSYTFPQAIVDHVYQDPTQSTFNLYSKPKGYTTVRYPYSGMVGTPAAAASSAQHNAQFNTSQAASLLSSNAKSWLDAGIIINGNFVSTGTRLKYTNCLHAPNFTVFSNTTSAQAWNDLCPPSEQVVSLESPHNDVHLAIGGYEIPGRKDVSSIDGANGDMGENDTAGLDPLFFFHHCEVDRYFWLWQQKNGSTDKLDIIAEYPGTNSIDDQGPTPGVAGGIWLTMESELRPFTTTTAAGGKRYYTSNDLVNIETQLGYTYDTPADFLDVLLPPQRAEASARIGNVDKKLIAGSHTLNVYAQYPGDKEKQLVAVESVLSRWHVSGCANCQLSATVQRHAPLHGISAEDVDGGKVKISVEVGTRAGRNKGGKGGEVELKPSLEVFGRKRRPVQ